MNRESLPLIIAVLIPIILVTLILLYYYGYDLTQFLRNIDLVYWIIIIPFVLGFFIIIVKTVRPDYY
ncbi:hypothetical protein AYK24_01065 [Thermoplasmatales archaeon SG8-52-4]|nr:MAG: hypothetical protein AYK24_01065 [Thermoplasmatales archaeon SG8-52-4]